MSDETEDEDELVRRARTDRDAFGRLYDLWHPPLYRYCLRRLLATAAAEDATAETFLRIAAALPRFAGGTMADFRAWAYRIASNVAAETLRRARRRDDLLAAATREGRFAAREGPWTEADAEEVARAVLALPEREQTAVALRYWEGLPTDRVAAVLGVRPGAARQLLHRAVARLRRRLGAYAAEGTP